MARNTTRDRIWTLALIRCLQQNEAVYPADLAAEIPNTSERTVRDTLNTMAGTPFIRRDVNISTGQVKFVPPEDRDFSDR